jgi:hypothetical protein
VPTITTGSPFLAKNRLMSAGAPCPILPGRSP